MKINDGGWDNVCIYRLPGHGIICVSFVVYGGVCVLCAVLGGKFQFSAASLGYESGTVHRSFDHIRSHLTSVLHG
jgi:hypothetical protein